MILFVFKFIEVIYLNIAKAAVNPPLTDRLGQLLTSEISLETDGFVG